MTTDPRLPVVLLTGFLGAGKTTALNRWLAEPALARALVLVNEIGVIPIDHHLVREVRDDVMVLASGCVCCSVRSDLVEALGALDTASFDRVVIETTGLADPAPVIATLLGDRRLATRFDLDRVITVVDLERGQDLLERFPEARKQVALADVLLVTKVDRASADVTARFEVALRRWNALSDLAYADRLSGAEVLVATRFSRRNVSRGVPPTGARAASKGLRLPLAHADSPTPHEHAGLRTHALPMPEPTLVRRLSLWLEMIARFHGDHLLRVKALVRDTQSGSAWSLQAVQHAVYPPELVDERVAPPPEALGLVLISVGSEAGVFDSLVASARTLIACDNHPS